MPIRAEMTEFVYPEIKFDNSSCNICDNECMFSIIDTKLNGEYKLQPISSNELP
jgi:MinD superfamily P-loop ATPase